MVLDANTYRVNIPKIKWVLGGTPEEKRLDKATMLAAAYKVPIIVMLCYVGELYGFSDDLDISIEKLKKFYAVTEVLNVNRI